MVLFWVHLKNLGCEFPQAQQGFGLGHFFSRVATGWTLPPSASPRGGSTQHLSSSQHFSPPASCPPPPGVPSESPCFSTSNGHYFFPTSSSRFFPAASKRLHYRGRKSNENKQSAGKTAIQMLGAVFFEKFHHIPNSVHNVSLFLIRSCEVQKSM